MLPHRPVVGVVGVVGVVVAATSIVAAGGSACSYCLLADPLALVVVQNNSSSITDTIRIRTTKSPLQAFLPSFHFNAKTPQYYSLLTTLTTSLSVSLTHTISLSLNVLSKGFNCKPQTKGPRTNELGFFWCRGLAS